MSGERKWSIEQEINLFSLVCDFKPAGVDRNKNLTQILIRINEHIDNDEQFTEQQVWTKLKDFFDLDKIEDIEKESDEEPLSPKVKTPKKEEPVRTSARAKSREIYTRESTIEQSPTPEVGTPKPEDTIQENSAEPELYSSELSDIEGEETELEKLHGKEPSPPPTRENRRRGRPKKSSAKLPVKEAIPVKEVIPTKEAPAITPRKRTRSIAKEGDEENTPKRVPAPQKVTRRKTRSDTTPEGDAVSALTPQTEENVNQPQEENLGTPENTEISADAEKENKNINESAAEESNGENKDESKTVAESAHVTENTKAEDNTEAEENTNAEENRESEQNTKAEEKTKAEENVKIEESKKKDESIKAAEITEEPKTRRSKRQAVRRSTRNK